jgi:hypothetical protein
VLLLLLLLLLLCCLNVVSLCNPNPFAPAVHIVAECLAPIVERALEDPNWRAKWIPMSLNARARMVSPGFFKYAL